MSRRPPQLLWIALAALAAGLVLLVLNHDAGSVLGMENDQFARLLQAGVIVTMLSAGFIAARRPIGQIAQNLAIWIVILLLLMTGYLYRYELQDIGSRVTAGLIPGSPLSALDGDGRTTVSITRADNGHFDARVLINGAPVRVMVDTGATTTVLSNADAASVGIDVEALSYTVMVSTANGTTMAARAPGGTIEIGDITRSRVPMLVARRGALEQSLLGMNFMGTLTGYDVRGDRMTLYD